MKGKLIFISLLLAFLVFVVIKMMEFEKSIRQERTVTLYIDDDTKPLFSKLANDDLIEATSNSDYYFMAGKKYFKKLSITYRENIRQTQWESFFIKGVNFGVAVPGKFPAEFSLNFNQYLEWLILIGEMNANVLRLYTILPPEFYDALLYYNLHHYNKPLFLMQGIWTELPVDEDFYNPEFNREFRREIMDAINVIHGNAVLKECPGKASGVYSSDVSKYVAAILLGREWEPSSVFKTNQINKVKHYTGDFICMNNGNAMEAWLAGIMDFTVLYEVQEYRFQHPVSFVNWLPLDPMFHETEIIENEKVREYDNDLERIDFMNFHSTELFYPGIYAAYHAYPYYPDFVYNQDSYLTPHTQDGSPNPYFRYLEDLKEHYMGMPLIIAEYGLPSSRGNSHFMPYGFHQGGHSEADQADLSLILSQNIVESGCAGAVYFEWIDEWFKHNWLVMDFEIPAEDIKLWHNMENPEQNFGICALENKIKAIDGKISDWENTFSGDHSFSLQSDADATYFYLAAKVPEFSFSKNNLFIAIDTYDKEKGDHKLPFTDKKFDHGFEFLLEFKSTDTAAILVDEPYSVFTDIYNDHIPVYASKNNNNGLFIRQLLLTNRSRESLLGIKTDSVIFDRSPLIFGNSADPLNSNSDWFFNHEDQVFEIRLTWHLLNVTDPVKRYVLDDREGTGEIEFSKTDAFNIYIFITDKNNNLIGQFPLKSPFTCTWDEWDTPEYSQRLKPVYFTLQDYFKKLSVQKPMEIDDELSDETFKITEYYQNKSGAISISFDYAGFSQYQYALPVLSKYDLSASFGVIPEMLEEVSPIYELPEDGQLKRLSTKEIKEIAGNHEITLQLENLKWNLNSFLMLKKKSNALISAVHCTQPSISFKPSEGIIFIRKHITGTVMASDYDGLNYLVVNSGVSQIQLDSILKKNKFKWTIVQYHHLYNSPGEIPAHINQNKATELFIHKNDFEKQIRLLRNTNYWIATESEVMKYQKEKLASHIQLNRFQSMIFMKIVNNLDRNIFDQPLTVEYKTSASIIKVTGSETDGIYSNKTGSFIFDAMPNKEITIEILK